MKIKVYGGSYFYKFLPHRPIAGDWNNLAGHDIDIGFRIALKLNK